MKRVEEHSTNQTVPIFKKLVSHTQHEIKYATVWKQLMQTHKMLFLSSRVSVIGASRGSDCERNPQSFITKHELLKITGRRGEVWGGRWTLRSVWRVEMVC